MIKRSTRKKTLKIKNKRLKICIKINNRGTKRDPAPCSEQTAQSKPFLVDIGEILTLKAAASAPTGRDNIVEILTILISNEQL